MTSLSLTRKRGESVVLIYKGQVIEVTIWKTTLGKAKLQFEAEPSVKIYRREVYDRILSNNESEFINNPIKE